MNRKYTQTEFMEIERAIMFAGAQIQKYCRNQKPVLLHSIGVGMKLLDNFESDEVVIAGILHDLVEDTKCTIQKIEKEFGAKVAALVSANTHDVKIKDYKKRWEKEASILISAGRDAMIVKIADALQNLPYYIEAPTKEIEDVVIWKHRHIIENFKNKIGNEPLYQEYVKKFNELV